MSSDLYAVLRHRLSSDASALAAADAAVAPLRPIAGAVIDAAATPTPAAITRLVDLAIAHGDQRREAGGDPDALLDAYTRLRRTLWCELGHESSVPETQEEAMARCESAATIALRASLLGFARTQLEAAGRWTASLVELRQEAEQLLAA